MNKTDVKKKGKKVTEKKKKRKKKKRNKQNEKKKRKEKRMVAYFEGEIRKMPSSFRPDCLTLVLQSQRIRGTCRPTSVCIQM